MSELDHGVNNDTHQEPASSEPVTSSSATQPVRERESRSGALKSSLTLELHTHYAIRLWDGRRKEDAGEDLAKKQKERPRFFTIFSMPQVIAVAGVANNDSSVDNPYADALLVKLENALGVSSQKIQSDVDELSGILKAIPQTLSLTDVRSVSPLNIGVYKVATDCTSGDEGQQPGTTQAGTGFAPMLEEATKANLEQLVKMVNGAEKPTAANLGKLKAGSLTITSGVIRALQRDPDNAALTGRLASELAMADTVETALLMRRMLMTGMSEPNAAAQEAAVDEGTRRIESLDREINALKNEMELKRELARNSVLTIIERENSRVETNPQKQIQDNTDMRVNQMTTPVQGK
ncbi:PFL_4669 family integrating conjugative element protein [Pectobacterium atrosepticum]|uniref:PFL_4669 family integrating conjugative element protein n=1 Tax=Pectobacterium atrosepticum TaxID=29471 RepID=UPI00203D33B9|nr:TIGR03761 family integrating conjugative element protein [Pectobacterium atrosepticum]